MFSPADTNPASQVTWATFFFFNSAPNICGSTVCNLLQITLWCPEFCSQIFENLCKVVFSIGFIRKTTNNLNPTVPLNSIPTNLQFLPYSKHNPSPSQRPTRLYCLGENIAIYYMWYYSYHGALNDKVGRK